MYAEADIVPNNENHIKSMAYGFCAVGATLEV